MKGYSRKTEPARKAEERRQVRRGLARAVFPHAAAVAWLSAALKITAFTLRLKNSRSDHLFRRKSSSSIVFPRPLRRSRPVTRLTLLASLASFHSSWMCEILCFLVYFALGLTPSESRRLLFVPGRPSLTRPRLLHRQNPTLTASKTQMFPSTLGMIYQDIPFAANEVLQIKWKPSELWASTISSTFLAFCCALVSYITASSLILSPLLNPSLCCTDVNVTLSVRLNSFQRK